MFIEIVRMTDPARRHKCELCKRVFECHICDIGEEHPLHSGSRLHLLHRDYLALICLECATLNDIDVMTVEVHNHAKTQCTVYDYQSGASLGIRPRSACENMNSKVGKFSI